MERLSRTYTITLGASQEGLSVTISDKRHRLELAWLLWPQQEYRTTYFDIDGDEREIVSGGLSADKKRLLVVVDYEPAGALSRPPQIKMALVDMLSEKERHEIEQCDLQVKVQQCRDQPPQQQRVHWCMTETNNRLNYQ
jgi:hypothetical protein